MLYISFLEPQFYIYFAIIAVNLIYGFIHFKKLQAPYKTLVFLLVVTLTEEVLIRILHAHRKNPYPIYHFFAPVQYLFFCIIYSQFNPKERIIRHYSVITIPLFFAFAVVNRIYFQNGPKDFPTNVLQTLSVLVLVHILYTYHQMLENLSFVPLYKQHLFWFNTANLIWFTCNFFYWAFFNQRNKEQSIEIFLKILQTFFTLIPYLLYGISLYLSQKKERT